jgi:hypothetical protein
MEQQHRREGEQVGEEQQLRKSGAPQAGPGPGTPMSGEVATQQGDLAIEEFQLDDIEEIESKVFA